MQAKYNSSGKKLNEHQVRQTENDDEESCGSPISGDGVASVAAHDIFSARYSYCNCSSGCKQRPNLYFSSL